MLVSVYVKPGSSRNRVGGVHDDRLVVAVTAAAVDGAANLAVIKAIAQALKISKSDVTVKSGLTSKRKVLEVRIMDEKMISLLRNQE